MVNFAVKLAAAKRGKERQDVQTKDGQKEPETHR